MLFKMPFSPLKAAYINTKPISKGGKGAGNHTFQCYVFRSDIQKSRPGWERLIFFRLMRLSYGVVKLTDILLTVDKLHWATYPVSLAKDFIHSSPADKLHIAKVQRHHVDRKLRIFLLGSVDTSAIGTYEAPEQRLHAVTERNILQTEYGQACVPRTDHVIDTDQH